MMNTLIKWESEKLDESMGIIPLEEKLLNDGRIKLKIVTTQKRDGRVRYQIGVYDTTSVIRMPDMDHSWPKEDVYALYNAISVRSGLSDITLGIIDTCAREQNGQLEDYLKFLELFSSKFK